MPRETETLERAQALWSGNFELYGIWLQCNCYIHGRHVPFIAKAAAPSDAVRLALGPGGNTDNAVVRTSITASAATAGLTAGKKLGEDVQVRAAT